MGKGLEVAIGAAVACAAKQVPVPDVGGMKSKLAKTVTSAIVSKIPKCKRRMGLVSALKGAACTVVTKACSPGCKFAIGAGAKAAQGALAGFPVSCFTGPVEKACISN